MFYGLLSEINPLNLLNFFIKVFIWSNTIFLKFEGNVMLKKTLIIIILCSIIITITAGSLNYANFTEHTILGSDSRGYITKDVYNPNSGSGQKIAIVTGMHPREKVSINVSSDAVKNYAQSHNVEIIQYNIVVKENLDYVFAGRKKGETLAADYIVPDIVKSNYDVVIICHDHKKGYGDGFYVAIPTMDSKSLALAEKFRKISPEYRYYQRDPEKKAQSKSILRVDTPIAKSGTPLFVYEIPEWAEYREAYDKTYKLIDTAYNVV